MILFGFFLFFCWADLSKMRHTVLASEGTIFGRTIEAVCVEGEVSAGTNDGFDSYGNTTCPQGYCDATTHGIYYVVSWRWSESQVHVHQLVINFYKLELFVKLLLSLVAMNQNSRFFKPRFCNLNVNQFGRIAVVEVCIEHCRITADYIFFHCTKAINRGHFWSSI